MTRLELCKQEAKKKIDDFSVEEAARTVLKSTYAFCKPGCEVIDFTMKTCQQCAIAWLQEEVDDDEY